jgi:hypothetical protein
LVNTDKEIADIKRVVKVVNENVLQFNKTRKLYKNRESNGYTIGAAVFALVIIKKSKLIYAVLDDCYFSIFSDDLIDHPILKSFVDISANHYNANYDWDKVSDRAVWRKKYRNNTLNIDGQTLGYGAVDGRSGFEKYIQYGEEKLKPNDLICLYTDGFIKIMRDTKFIKKLKGSKFSIDSLNFISKYTQNNQLPKEKTCYFIKYLG